MTTVDHNHVSDVSEFSRDARGIFHECAAIKGAAQEQTRNIAFHVLPIFIAKIRQTGALRDVGERKIGCTADQARRYFLVHKFHLLC